MDLKQIEYDSPEHAQMLDLRNRILRHPLGLVLTPEEIEKDQGNYLLGYFDARHLVACAILVKQEDGLQIRQVAVDDGQRGRGIGSRLLEGCYALAQQWGYGKVYCHTPETAERFYRENGWKVVSEIFLEQDIPHYRMEYILPEAV